MKLTDEQNAILEYLSTGNGHVLIDAKAGSSKTTVLFKALSVVPQKTVLLCAFNKRIADELQQRMPPVPKGSVHVASTFHSAGLRIINHHKRMQVSPQATEELVNDACTTLDGDLKIPFKVRRAAVRLLRILKETFSGPEFDLEAGRNLGFVYDIFAGLTDDKQIDLAVMTAMRAYDLGLDLKNRGTIDFCDMTWLPVVCGLKPPSRYQAVFVDELQDLSLLQWELVKTLVAPNGRIVAVGDLSQAIYKFKGAIGLLIWAEMKETLNAKQLPLTITFRCSQAVVSEARQLVPTLNMWEDAPRGSVTTIDYAQLADHLRPNWDKHTFILSRTNADLLQVALDLHKHRVPFHLAASKEIIEPLFEIIDKLDKLSSARFRASLVTWFNAEIQKAEAMHAPALAEKVEQQFAMIGLLLTYAQPVQFKRVLQEILGHDITAITLSTVHKAKGLEADRVYLLRQTFHRYQRREKVDPEELNCEYVAITRAKRDLIWVDLPGGLSAAARMMTADLIDEAAQRRAIAHTSREQLHFNVDSESHRED
jgi:superfamily I DNA/RNA helicase